MSTPTQQEILAAHVAARRVLDAMRYRLRVAEYDRESAVPRCNCDPAGNEKPVEAAHTG